MKIGILGGAFNPITKAHLEIADFVLKHTDVDEIWLMPCWSHPFGKVMASYEDRLRMIQLALTGEIDNRITWSTYERDRELSGKTWETLRSLQRARSLKNHEFFWIIGADEACVITAWANIEWLRKNAKFIVVPRKGYERMVLAMKKLPDGRGGSWIFARPSIDLTEVESISKISSTAARQAVQDGKKGQRRLRNLIPGNVLGYIRDRRLYATAIPR